MKKLELHWQILIGMLLGLILGWVFSTLSWGPAFVKNWIKPFGTVFINVLKLIAVPLIITSLIKGISDLKEISKFKSMGLKTLTFYLASTVLAVLVGLILVNMINPGASVSAETVAQLSESYASDASGRVEVALAQKDNGPLQFFVDMVPSNFFAAASDNGNMLQIIFFVIFFGIGLLLIKPAKQKPIMEFIDSLNEVIMKMVDLIMLIAPFAVFALLASLITETTNPDLFIALMKYALTVVIGLSSMILIYILVVRFVVKMPPSFFLKGIGPAQLLAFSTSSSAATLPVTMERVEEHLGVRKDVVSFVCPVGATINMDGTSLYQAIAAVFICTALNFDLSLGQQLTIIMTATLASIGSAAVPSAGIIMLVIVLESVGLPADKLPIGLALIIAIDRPLDMLRTVINVTGDATVALLVGKTEGALTEPNVKNWDDHYKKRNN